MCGEHYDTVDYDNYDAGSSPHVRGAPRSSAAAVSAIGIIPACAGSTTSPPST